MLVAAKLDDGECKAGSERGLVTDDSSIGLKVRQEFAHAQR